MTDISRGLGPHLDDEALSATVDAEATAAEMDHLSGCPRCRARLSQLAAVARAGGVPVPPRAASDVCDAIDRAMAGTDSTGGMTPSLSDRSPRHEAEPVAATVGRERANLRWAAAAAALAAAVAVVAGLVTMTGGRRGPSATAARPRPSTASGPAATRAGGASEAAASVDGGDLGDQSDPAVVAADLTSRLSISAPSPRGSATSTPSSAEALGPNPPSNAARGRTPCAAQGPAAAGLVPGPSAIPRLVASLRWRGQPAVVAVYATPHGLTAVIMRSADCARVAVFPL